MFFICKDATCVTLLWCHLWLPILWFVSAAVHFYSLLCALLFSSICHLWWDLKEFRLYFIQFNFTLSVSRSILKHFERASMPPSRRFLFIRFFMRIILFSSEELKTSFTSITCSHVLSSFAHSSFFPSAVLYLSLCHTDDLYLYAIEPHPVKYDTLILIENTRLSRASNSFMLPRIFAFIIIVICFLWLTCLTLDVWADLSMSYNHDKA